MKNSQYRQGDVCIERIDALPTNIKPAKLNNGKVILALGEVTGHAHSFVAEDAEKLTSEKGEEFFRVTGRPLTFQLPILRQWKNQVMVQHPTLGVIEFARCDVTVEDNQVVVDDDFGLLRHDELQVHAIPAGLYKGSGMNGTVQQRQYTPAAIVRAND